MIKKTGVQYIFNHIILRHVVHWRIKLTPTTTINFFEDINQSASKGLKMEKTAARKTSRQLNSNSHALSLCIPVYTSSSSLATRPYVN